VQGDTKVVQYLNTVLTNELTAINQYFLHARTFEHWGVTKLGRHEYKESMEEMRHADALIQRILFLEGLPNVQRLNQIMIGQTSEEIIRCDMKLEEKAVADLREAIAHCETVRDFASRDLLLGILRDEEEHIDFMEAQFHTIENIGVQNWIQLNSGAADEGGAH
jgi:bacterioferritin